MAKEGTVTFTGASGARYTFNYYKKDVNWKAVAAVYIFTKRTVSAGKGAQTALYIGETHSLKERIPGHEKWPCVNKHGCTHIAVRTESNQTRRREIESDLMEKQDPLCNSE